MDLKMLKQLLKTCGNDTRLRIINLLSDKELIVKDICDLLKLTQPTLSKHLLRLRLLRIVIDRREGNAVFYRLNQNLESPQGKIVQFIVSHFSGLEAFAKDKKTSLKRVKYVKEVRDTSTGEAVKIAVKKTVPTKKEKNSDRLTADPMSQGRF